MPTLNPFWDGAPIPLEKFIGRDEKIRRIASRISTGQSSAISGSPRCGKTSLLYYLKAPEKQKELYGDEADKLIFSYLDASTWGNDFDRRRFWLEALGPLHEQIEKMENNEVASELASAYEICQKPENELGGYVLERLFARLKKANKRLILIIDEFDLILQHPVLKNSTEFFGGIRSIASRSETTLVIIITTNFSVSQLMAKTEKFTGSGSPYFNFIGEEILGALSNEEIDSLLQNNKFSYEDFSFIKDIAGGHPYLLQVLASSLWQVYEEQPEKDFKERQQQAEKYFYLKVESTLNQIWQNWQENTRQAFRSVALVQMDKLKRAFQRQGIDVESLSRHIPSLHSDLEFLKQYGFLIEEPKIAGGWRVYPKIFLPFFIDKRLKSEYREKLPVEVWQHYLAPNGL